MKALNSNLLKTRINLAYCNRGDKIPKEPTVKSALDIFKEIKKMERYTKWGDIEANYRQELSSAKEDLEYIFKISEKEIKTMTKNNLYMKHQSLMVNAIYELLTKGKV